ncbi:AraC family transcriptional regulator [Methylocapsa sp. S129]|uniref:helix-turn-helix domain-containing protein n=1 Tax=Methylocapsa sp. S129 TaxID=1641869 RepID=UPI00131EC4CF|nr:helix-turn-helix domain-containing protein [Methylocapsa sp. S129]
MIAAVLLRDRANSAAVRLSIALYVCAIAYAIREAPTFPRPWPWWSLPLAVVGWGSPVVFWLWARATFDDEFALRRWHAGLWAALVGLGFLAWKGGAIWPSLGMASDRAEALAELVLALLAVSQTFATWRADLVAGRRRLRIVVLIGALAYTVAWPLSDLSIRLMASGSLMGSLVDAFGLCVLAMVSAWSLLQAEGRDQGAPLVSALGDGLDETRPIIPAGEDGRSSVEPSLLRRLERLMTAERAYRQEGLTIGSLAGLMGVPEYRLRQIINEGLGCRNFSAFLNRYRIDEAKTALADSGQKDVPVLTIAMDSGFQSLGPFNRAFKADTGLTPTEFRRLALAKAPSKPLSETRNFEIGEAR